jgi:hypothetical protein
MKIDVVQKFWDVFISQCNDNPNDSEICIKLASYIFALEIMKFNDSKLQLGTKIYKYSPNAVIDVVGRQLLSLEGKDQNPNLRERVMIFTSYQQRLRDIIKVKELKVCIYFCTVPHKTDKSHKDHDSMIDRNE